MNKCTKKLLVIAMKKVNHKWNNDNVRILIISTFLEKISELE